MDMQKIHAPKLPRIGLYSAGLEAYWGQFAGLKECLLEYNEFIARKLAAWGIVVNAGLVDTELAGQAAGELFATNHVDIVFAHSATYFTSATVLPIHQICKAPAVFLSLQPAAAMNYAATGTDRWLAQCVACPLPEAANAFERAGIGFHAVNGLLGFDKTPAFALSDETTQNRPEAVRAWEEIRQWCMAAAVKRGLQSARFGFLGGYYSGMLDMYSDLTMLQAQTGIHTEVLEMCDLDLQLQQVTVKEAAAKQALINAFFTISGDSPSDPIAKKPTQEQMEWACKVAAAQERLVRSKGLDALAYYYHGQHGNHYEQLQSGFIVGHSLLTAAGVPCAGEGDIKTALAMKICDMLGTGGSFCEIIAADFERNTLIIGHDGPFHIAIADGKPILRGMGIYHGKRGSGVSVEAKVRPGPVTTLGVTQGMDGRLKLNISEGEAIQAPILMNGNTMTHVQFAKPPAAYMDDWFAEYPTHHCALSVGHNAALLQKVSKLLNIPCAVF